MTRYIFITGGVVSSLGKGLASAVLGSLLQARGFEVGLCKLDPYLNVDPGTMNPFQHGEVYVTDDGIETDLDLGHYERFTGMPCTRNSNITTGQVYQDILARERRGDYLGGTVQVIPHVTDAIKSFICREEGRDFLLCEIGGTVGDIEGLPFFEAIRQLRLDLGRERTIFVHLTLVPRTGGEMKTKPTQHSVKDLRSIGIQPDILLCRCDGLLPVEQKRKISLFCNVPESAVVEAQDVETIYEAPLIYHKQGLDAEVLRNFGMEAQKPDLRKWREITQRIRNPEGEVTLAIVGKYTNLPDAYKSLEESVVHGGIANRVRVNIRWMEAEIFEKDALSVLDDVDGILVPGGFGIRGMEGMIATAQYARTRQIPYLGICLGMQMAVVEAARNLLGLQAGSTEFGETQEPVVGLLTEWMSGESRMLHSRDDNMGGTMRLGVYEACLLADSRIAHIYGTQRIFERHRHRYEVNTRYQKSLESEGLRFSGMSPDGLLPEVVELQKHPWFIGVQFHPEFKSRPFDPHPLFTSFVAATVAQSRLV